MVNQFLKIIKQFKPSELLTTKQANNMYKNAPTMAENFLGLKLMTQGVSNTNVIKYSAIEPVYGVMKSVGIGEKAPISDKRESKQEKHITVYFKDSVVFDSQELLTIAQASKSNSEEAQIQIARDQIILNIEQLKTKSANGDEKLFWEGCQGTMNVPELVNGNEVTRAINTFTRQIAALTGNDGWNIAPAGSTADPTGNIRIMQQSFTGKGSALRNVYMNLVTLHALIATAGAGGTGLRDLWKYTTTDLEQKAISESGLILSGVPMKVYNETYNDDSKVNSTFIPDGKIIGFGESRSMTQGIVEYVKALNIDAQVYGQINPNSAPQTVFGSFLDAISEKNPTSLSLVHTKNALPVFKMPQLIVHQTVFS